MASLREIKDRIGSVRNTLKITSAMKLVASAKLHKAQAAITDMLPYEEELRQILSLLPPMRLDTDGISEEGLARRAAIVSFASNSSLCGAFNSNVLRETLGTIRDCRARGLEVDVYPVGRKIADALRREGYTCQEDYNSLVGTADYEASAGLARSLVDRFSKGELCEVLLVYNHFVNTSTQKVLVEQYLPLEQNQSSPVAGEDCGYILEPDAQGIVDSLGPQVLNLKIHTVILDSLAAEHSARVVAMQTASDNAEDLLSELTLEYNKGRQQKITSEILDLLGGAAG